MKRSLWILGVMMLLAGAPPAGFTEPLIRDGEHLTLERCIDIAVRNQPAILQYHYTAQVNEALLGQARSAYYPQVDLTANYNQYNAISRQNDAHSPITQYGYEYAGNNVTLKQKIYDFGKREANVDVALFNRQAALSDVENQITGVINNVKTAYYGVLSTKRARAVHREAIDQYRQQLEQARLFFESGKKPKYDVTTAEVNLSSAEVKLIQAESDLDNAWVQLNNAMGYDGSSRYTIEDTSAPGVYQIDERVALEQAYQKRSDLQSLITQKASAQRAVDAARKDYFPSLEASAGYDFAGSQTPLSQGWNAGVALTWNLFKGLSTKTEIEKAAANLKVVEAKIAGLKLQIRQDIKKAQLDMKKAKETMANADVQVRQATENLELANLRYQTGLGTPLDVTNATVSYSNAKLTQIAAVYQFYTAVANIEKAMGNR
ncbi:MAG: TolC family protein [Pseudomonadota bacterium]